MRSQKRSFPELLARGLLHLERRFRHRDGAHSQSVLILAYMPALGYAVHMTPVYEALHRAGYTVIVATHGLNLGLLRLSPYVDHLLETPDPMHNLPGAVLSLRRQLARFPQPPVCVFTGPQDARTRIGLLAALGCTGWRGGYSVHPALYYKPLLYNRALSRVANNLRLAELLDCDTEGCIPRIFFSPAEHQAAMSLLPARRPILAIVAGNSGGLPTSWHDERWAAVLIHAHQELGYELLYLGTARDQPAINRIRSLAGDLGTSLAGRTSLGELAAVLAESDLCLSLMTGTLHLARAAGTPTLALGLAWEPPLEWMTPLEPQVHLLRGADAPRTPGYRLDELSAAQVKAELTVLSQLYPPSAKARAERVARSLSLSGEC